MKIHKLISVLFIFVLAVSSFGCSKSAETSADDKRVLNAISVLEEWWNKKYDDADIEDKYLKIINAKVINIKDNIDSQKVFDKEEMFENIDYVVEFDLISNYFDSAPYYCNVGIGNCVIVYKDGNTKVSNNLFNMYRAATYSADFTPIIESVEEYNEYYNQIIEF